MGIKWDAKKRTYVYTKPKRKKSKNYNYNRAIKNKSAQISTRLENLNTIWDKFAPLMEKMIEEKRIEEEDKKIIKENKKQAKALASKIRGFNTATENPIDWAIEKAKKQAKEMWQQRGTSKDNGGKAVASHALHAGAEALDVAWQLVKQSSNLNYNRYITLQEDYITNQAINNAMDSINRAKQAGSSILSGAASGAATGGVVGAIIGGIAGAIKFGNSQYVEYQQRMSSYYQQLNATNFQTNFDASRLGLIGSSGTEN